MNIILRRRHLRWWIFLLLVLPLLVLLGLLARQSWPSQKPPLLVPSAETAS